MRCELERVAFIIIEIPRCHSHVRVSIGNFLLISFVFSVWLITLLQLSLWSLFQPSFRSIRFMRGFRLMKVLIDFMAFLRRKFVNVLWIFRGENRWSFFAKNREKLETRIIEASLAKRAPKR
jgi:hypothetical protein